MIKEFLQPRRESVLVEDKEKVSMMLPMRVIDQPELSLGPSISVNLESDANFCKKRKHSTWDGSLSATQRSIELQLNDPLPMDWEQCLDLQSGRMYYLNRKTLQKSWVRPREQNLDLELNISTLPSSKVKNQASSNTTNTSQGQHPIKDTNSSSSMVAVACRNCHLLVMLSKSSPSCPNCKYVHSLPHPELRKIEAVKPLETLSLLH
ncbi:uncharacterized protein LOC109829463 [Asparagus officinalis]|nr:uncharacterized protein LOC109829463 [Asparagus officinalis]